VKDRVDAVAGAGDGGGIANVPLLEIDIGWAVVGVDQVEDPDLRPPRDESSDQVRTQISGSAGDEL